jgi:signal peptidase I
MQNHDMNEKNYENPLGQTDETEEEELLTPEEEAAERTKSTAKELFEWVELFAYSVSIVIILFTFICRIAVVSGPSMEKTLFDREVLLVSDLFYEPKQGDVIVFQSNTILDNEAIVKRVIATEGQTVDIDFENWIVYVDGEAIEEPYINFEAGRYMNGSDYSYPLTVEEGKIFVMGDNRNHSTDSRDNRIGQVDTRFVLGKVLVRILPFDTFGIID